MKAHGTLQQVCCQGGDKKLVSGAVFLTLVPPANIYKRLSYFKIFFIPHNSMGGTVKTPQMHTRLPGTFSSLS